MTDTQGQHFTTAIARVMLVEGQAATMVRAFGAVGIPALLLKGATLDRWLYPDGDRTYGDVDLLVPPRALPAAERRLHELGFVNKYDGVSPEWAEEHADTWLPPEGGVPIDLHRRVWGVGVGAGRCWDALWSDRRPLTIGATEVPAPSQAARVLLVALHAAHHGTDHPRPIEDLRRAVQHVDRATWEAALALAGTLEARAAMAAGMELLQDGGALRECLGLPRTGRRELRSDLWTAPPTTAGFLRLLEAPSTVERVRLVVRELFPSRAFMRSQAHGGQRGRSERLLVPITYASRWVDLARRAPSGLRSAVAIRRRRGRRR